jgi:hypothetical protein
MENLFERASKYKLRFKMTNGQLSVEDLWDLSLEYLDKLAKALNKQKKESEEESFIKKPSKASTLLNLQFDIVKHVIEVKLVEEEEAKTRAQKAAKKAQLLELIGRKELQSLESKSIEELTKELETL